MSTALGFHENLARNKPFKMLTVCTNANRLIIVFS